MRRLRHSVAVPAVAAVAVLSFARADEVDDYVAAEIERQKVPGISIAVLRQPAGGQKLPLRPFAEAEFFVEGAEVEIAFLEDAGSVTALEMRRLGGGSNRAKKVN